MHRKKSGEALRDKNKKLYKEALMVLLAIVFSGSASAKGISLLTLRPEEISRCPVLLMQEVWSQCWEEKPQELQTTGDRSNGNEPDSLPGRDEACLVCIPRIIQRDSY